MVDPVGRPEIEDLTPIDGGHPGLVGQVVHGGRVDDQVILAVEDTVGGSTEEMPLPIAEVPPESPSGVVALEVGRHEGIAGDLGGEAIPEIGDRIPRAGRAARRWRPGETGRRGRGSSPRPHPPRISGSRPRRSTPRCRPGRLTRGTGRRPSGRRRRKGRRPPPGSRRDWQSGRGPASNGPAREPGPRQGRAHEDRPTGRRLGMGQHLEPPPRDQAPTAVANDIDA